MKPVAPEMPAAPAVETKLAAAREMLSELELEVGQHALAASQGRPGASQQLTAHRGKIENARTCIVELEAALRLAKKLDRQAVAASAAAMRASQFSEFKSACQAREKSMEKLLTVAVPMLVQAYAEFSEATLLAAISLPSGTAVPQMSIGRDNLYGPAFGPCERLILAEMFKLAPTRSDGAGRLVLPFSRPPSEMLRGQPDLIPPGIEELRSANQMILADIARQMERLNETALRDANTSIEQKDVDVAA